MHTHDHSHEHHDDGVKKYLPVIDSFSLLFLWLAMDYWLKSEFFLGFLWLAWYSVALLVVAVAVIRHSVQLAVTGNLFTEFFLMSLATIGAFGIGEYSEGVAVMLFYTVGELFQDAAVGRSRKNVKTLLDQRPSVASVFRNGIFQA